jgi:anti-sigma factor RsiW
MRTTGPNSVLEMQPQIQHPTEETLENFLLHRMQDEELETTETHILACDSCVARLEAMEIQLEATRIALAEFHNETVEKNYAATKSSRWAWLKVPSLSLAGAGAALAIALGIVPQFTTVERSVNAVMGSEVTAVPANRSLLLHLNAKDLPQEKVSVQVVSADGNEVWKGNSSVHNDTVDAKLPKFHDKGNYLIRLYEPGENASTEGSLLREFSFAVE